MTTQTTHTAPRSTLATAGQRTGHWIAATLCAFGVLAGGAAQAATVSVAILNGSSGTMGTTALAAQLNDDTYFDFTASVLSGSTITSASALSGYDVVLLGGSGNSQAEYAAGTLSAVNSFLQAGGGVVTAGWYRFGAIVTANQADADAITPVVTGGRYNFAYGGNLVLTNTLHAITQGVNPFSVPGCCFETATALDVGAVSLGQVNNQTAVAYQDTVGRSVYLGALYSANPNYGTAALRSGSADRLLEQSVAWAAQGHSQITTVHAGQQHGAGAQQPGPAAGRRRRRDAGAPARLNLNRATGARTAGLPWGQAARSALGQAAGSALGTSQISPG